eukprot:gene9441-8848_t
MIKPPTWIDPEGAHGMKPGWRAAGCTGKSPPPGEEGVIGCISQ